jgi:urea transporter
MKRPFHRLLIALALGFVLAVIVQWAWNTVAPLFGGPPLEFRHALAGLVLLAIATAVMQPRRLPLRRLRGEWP